MLICDSIENALIMLPEQYYKLILVILSFDANNKDFIKKLSNDYKFDIININYRLSEKLISIPLNEILYYNKST